MDSDPNTCGAMRSNRSRSAGKHVHINPEHTSMTDHSTIPQRSQVGFAVDAYRAMDLNRSTDTMVILPQKRLVSTGISRAAVTSNRVEAIASLPLTYIAPVRNMRATPTFFFQ